jgi:hypothetical protein
LIAAKKRSTISDRVSITPNLVNNGASGISWFEVSMKISWFRRWLNVFSPSKRWQLIKGVWAEVEVHISWQSSHVSLESQAKK